MANYIYIGDISAPSFSFDGDSIMRVNINMAANVIGRELSADSFEAEIEYDDASGDLRGVGYATPIYYIRDGQQDAKFYITLIKRIGLKRYVIQATSFVGIFNTQMFYGGVYRRFNMQDLVETIIASNGLARYKQLSVIRLGPAESGSTAIKGIKLTSGSATIFADNLMYFKFKLSGITAYSTAEQAIVGSPMGQGGNTTYGYGLSLRGNGTTPGGAYKFLLKLRYCKTDHTVYSSLVIGDTVTIDLKLASGRKCYWTVEHEDGTVESGIISLTFADFIPGVMKSFGGGTTASDAFDSHNYILDVYAYYLTNGRSNPSIIFQAVPLIDMNTGDVIIRDVVTGYTAELPGASSLPGTIASRTGDYEDTIEVDNTARDILDSLEFDSKASTIAVTGWLKVDTKRNALYQVLFASCVNMLHTADGKVRFTFLDKYNQEEIQTDDIYQEGEVEEPTTIRKISLTEHSIDYIGAEDVVFDNTGDAQREGTMIALFNQAPISGTPVASSGLTIHTWSSNAALISGVGTITARVYHHDRKVIEKKFDVVQGADISVGSAQLVSFINSDNVFQRLLSYYGSAYKVRCAFLYSDELPGNRYSFTDLFNESRLGYMERMSLFLSEKVKASCEFVCGYTPPDYVNQYIDSVVLTGSGTWTVPSSVFEKDTPQIRVVLIGGGDGGYSGCAGKDAVQGIQTKFESKTSAKGGDYGKPGTPGKILDFVIKNPASSISYACGSGGAGGTCQEDGKSGAGASGTNTTLTNRSTIYTSADGDSRKLGILDIFHDINYAYEIVLWDETGGKGGDGGYVYITDNSQFRYGNYPYDFAPSGSAYNPVTGITYSGGKYPPASYYEEYAAGGSYGGAAVGRNGNRGIESRAWGGKPSYEEYITGKGGDGADATYIPDDGFYGCGGAGGAGGGGAGSIGFYTPSCEERRKVNPQPFEIPKGGRGGVGGKGGDGCIIIYY